MVYPQIYSTNLDSLRLLAAFGERQIMAQLIARQLIGSSLINKDF
jgi:hypothetical protein